VDVPSLRGVTFEDFYDKRSMMALSIYDNGYGTTFAINLGAISHNHKKGMICHTLRAAHVAHVLKTSSRASDALLGQPSDGVTSYAIPNIVPAPTLAAASDIFRAGCAGSVVDQCWDPPLRKCSIRRPASGDARQLSYARVWMYC
jgi:hypothetical protein